MKLELKPTPRLRLVAGVIGAAGIAIPALMVGTAHAAGPDAAKTRPTAAIVAIGQVKDASGAICTVDVRAATREKTGGALRFYCPDIGFYNGAVRSLSVQGSNATLSGGGRLTEPDGKRERVQYTATVSADGKQVSINVRSKDGDTYTIAGALDPGFVRAGVPAPKTPKLAPSAIATPNS